jgi:glycosyltransferase involved in cell wall biosynthesis
MQQLPTVSVVIPTYNYGRFIGEAIESALGQSHAPLELIVVDDGSTDDTLEVLAKYRGKVNYISQKNQGPSAARNKGILASRGEWIAFLDADDLWFEDKLQRQMECAAAHPRVCLIGALSSKNNGDPGIQSAGAHTLINTADLLGGLPFGTSSVVARRRELISAGLFNESRRYVEDRELWLKLSTVGAAARVNRVLWSYRAHANQANTNSKCMADNYYQVLNEFFEAAPEFKKFRRFAYAYYEYDSAMSFHEAGKNLTALGHLLSSYLRSPLSLERRQSEKDFARSSLLVRTIFGQRGFMVLRSLARWFRPRRNVPPAVSSARASG